MSNSLHPAPQSLRTLFLSDLHLGNAGARADLVLTFLKTHRADAYVLVGDILDFWHAGHQRWGEAEQRVIDHLHLRRCEGASVTYVRGNHDPAPETAIGPRNLPGPAVAQILHEAADGRRYIVIHGDEEDHGPFRVKSLQRIGAAGDRILRRIDRAVAGIARDFGFGQGRGVMPPIISALNALMYQTRAHERRLVRYAQALGVDGVICGHFHLPTLHDRHRKTYGNCGDWLDNFTALAEDQTGRLSLLQAAPEIAASRRGWPMLRLRNRIFAS